MMQEVRISCKLSSRCLNVCIRVEDVSVGRILRGKTLLWKVLNEHSKTPLWPLLPNSISLKRKKTPLLSVASQQPSDSDRDSESHLSLRLSVSVSSTAMFWLPIRSLCLSAGFIFIFFQAGVLIWHLCLLLLLSPTRPAAGGHSDGDEESGRGQRHLAVPPPVLVVRLPGHRVAAAETKLQAESGRDSRLDHADLFRSRCGDVRGIGSHPMADSSVPAVMRR